MLEGICTARIPKSALNWLRRSHGAALLADLAAGKLPVTHQALDADPRRRAAGFLRQMLTAGGALPPRDEELARTGQWLGGVLETIEPAAAQRVARAYATWQVMRRLRASAGRAARPRTYTAHAHRNLRAAAGFLAWLADRRLALAACRQADIDTWLATGPAACQAGDFLAWAAAHGHCQAFALPGRARPSGPAASQDQRWAQAAQLLHDDTLDLTDRAAGCLLLLYGQQLSRTAAMTTSQITIRDGTVLVRFGNHDIPVPEPLGVILTELIRTGRTHTGTGSPLTTPWLFPGGLPGRPSHRIPARPAPEHPGHLRHGRPPRHAHRPRRPPARRRPRRPAAHGPWHRSPLDAPGRRRLVRLRRRTGTNPSSPALTNTSRQRPPRSPIQHG